MAAKKKAIKKKSKRTIRKTFATQRALSMDTLRRKYRACTGSALSFGTLFQTFDDVQISEDRVRGLNPEWVDRNADRLINGQGWILSSKGQTLFERAAGRAGVLVPVGGFQKREHLALMARYYVRYPATGS